MSKPARPNPLALFARPQSIAVIGASPDLSRYPGKVINNLRRYNYSGRVYAITPRYEEVLGYRCYPDMKSVPEPVDVALVLLSAANAPAALGQAAAAGCKSAIIYSAGMAEVGDQGKALQAELTRIVEDSGIRILGPNCLGTVNVLDKTILCGAAALVRERLIEGQIGVAAQSGGMMGSIIDRAWSEGIGISYAFSTGNEADLDLADCIEFLAEDEKTKAISLFIESVRNVDRFRDACLLAAKRNKPVVALKIGRSERGRHVALTHTAALTGDDRAYSALFDRLGVVRVNSLDDLYLTPNLLINSPPPAGPRVAIACSSGGLAGHAADLCTDLGIELSDLKPETAGKIRQLQAGFGDAYNPLDITGHVVSKETWWMVKHILELLLADPNVDALVFGQPTSQFSDEASSDIIAIASNAKKPIYAFWTGRNAVAPALNKLREANVPVFEDAAACLRAVRTAIDLRTVRQRVTGRTSKPEAVDSVRAAKARRILAASPNGLSEFDGKRLLSLYGIAGPKEKVVRGGAAATAAAEAIGYPVAVKAHGAELHHKSELGGVRLNLKNAREVREAFKAVTASASVNEALIARMVGPGSELILGLVRDPQIGPVLVVGTGGIFVEVLHDARIAIPPLTEADAEDLLKTLRGAPLLDGVRGRPAAKRPAIIKAIMGLSRLAVEIGDAVEQIDVNPLIAGPGGAWAVDALVIPRLEDVAGGERLAGQRISKRKRGK
jgi:acetyltransferase